MSFHVKRKEREITDPAELRQILRKTNYVTIALCKDNDPYLVALNHGYDEEKNCLYFHCATEGKKLVYAQANPKVWGQAVLDFGVTDECDYAYTCVHFQGTLSLLSDPEEKRHGLEVLVRQVALNPESKLSKIKPEKIAKTTMGKITLNYLSGKKHQPPPKSPT
jgi:nitroimidazol reductase NimA-like FMN-containing flavoprotein (pyridoxamine 5'-phosphate oxidase superfamily)